MRSALAGLALLVAACNTPSAFVIHSPMQPTAAQSVTYTASGADGNGVSSIEIWENRNTLGSCSNGLHCATGVSTTLLHTCNYSPAQPSATCTFTTSSGYPDGSFIGYRTVVKNVQNKTATDGWIYYAAGAYPWPDETIPIYGTAAPADAVDVVFMPDTTYNGNNAQFITDISSLVANGYLSTNDFSLQVRPFRRYWNLYVTYHSSTAHGYQNGCNDTPDNWTTLRAIADVGGIVHPGALRDCAGIGFGSLLSIRAGANSTLVHESGHAVFSLADEYCCDGGYWQIGPHANVFSSQGNCTNDATAQGWPVGDCRRIDPNQNWWHSDADGDLMTDSQQQFGRSDQAQVYSLYFDQCYGGGC